MIATQTKGHTKKSWTKNSSIGKWNNYFRKWYINTEPTAGTKQEPTGREQTTDTKQLAQSDRHKNNQHKANMDDQTQSDQQKNKRELTTKNDKQHNEPTQSKREPTINKKQHKAKRRDPTTNDRQKRTNSKQGSMKQTHNNCHKARQKVRGDDREKGTQSNNHEMSTTSGKSAAKSKHRRQICSKRSQILYKQSTGTHRIERATTDIKPKKRERAMVGKGASKKGKWDDCGNALKKRRQDKTNWPVQKQEATWASLQPKMVGRTKARADTPNFTQDTPTEMRPTKSNKKSKLMTSNTNTKEPEQNRLSSRDAMKEPSRRPKTIRWPKTKAKRTQSKRQMPPRSHKDGQRRA